MLNLKIVCNRCSHEIVGAESAMFIKFGFASQQELSFHDLDLDYVLNSENFICLCQRCKADFNRFLNHETPQK